MDKLKEIIKTIISYIDTKGFSAIASLGIGVLITDHNVRETLKITDRAYIIKDGKIFATGDPVGLSENPEVRRIYLGEDFRL